MKKLLLLPILCFFLTGNAQEDPAEQAEQFCETINDFHKKHKKGKLKRVFGNEKECFV